VFVVRYQGLWDGSDSNAWEVFSGYGVLRRKLTSEQAAGVLGISRKTLYNRIKSGMYSFEALGHHGTNSRNARFDTARVVDFALHEELRNV
jgi:hypothetical protein